jgi:nucleotide-binding universal stress UspA family protein
MVEPNAFVDMPAGTADRTALANGLSSTAQAREAARQTLRRILLATDLTETSELATQQAIALAAALEATLIAVTIIDPGRLRVGGRPARVDQVRSERERMMAGLLALARQSGVDCEFLIWVGDPGESILEAARSERASLIVVGSHGRSGVGRFLIGSVSDEVIRHSLVPVLVVGPSGVRPERP